MAMNQFCAFIVLLLAASLTLGCGNSSSNRQLQSITIDSTVSGQQVQFTATGTFSEPPTTVSPLPVADWGIGPFAPPPPSVQYTLTTQPFLFDCTGSGPYLPVSTLAPSDPNAPATGSLPFAEMVTATAPIPCP
jgi:hypothetical protein